MAGNPEQSHSLETLKSVELLQRSAVGVEQCPEQLPGVFSSLSVPVLIQGESEKGKMNGRANHANTSTPSSGFDSIWKLMARSFISSLSGRWPEQPGDWAQAGRGQDAAARPVIS